MVVQDKDLNGKTCPGYLSILICGDAAVMRPPELGDLQHQVPHEFVMFGTWRVSSCSLLFGPAGASWSIS